VTVAAVVVRWRGGEMAARAVASLYAHGGRRLRRVVVVDSGSGDGGGERLAATFPAAELVALPVNRSFAHAANRGAERCSEDSLLLFNPDARLTPGALDRLASHLAARPTLAAVVPLLYHPESGPQHRWQLRRLPSVARLAAGLPGAAAFPTGPPSSTAPVAQPAAAAWLVRRTVWSALGGLDPAFAPAWWEDVDFCARLAAALGRPSFPAAEGFEVVPSARVEHLGGASREEMSDTAFLTAYHSNLLRYAASHHLDRLGIIRSGLVVALCARAALRPGRARAYLAAARAVRRQTAPPPSTPPSR